MSTTGLWRAETVDGQLSLVRASVKAWTMHYLVASHSSRVVIAARVFGLVFLLLSTATMRSSVLTSKPGKTRTTSVLNAVMVDLFAMSRLDGSLNG